MRSGEGSESCGQEPRQADGEVTARRETAGEGRREHRAGARAELRPPSLWMPGHLSQGHGGFVAGSLMHPDRRGSTNRQRRGKARNG